EEITTIFVVGFPEDIHEREFRGMFVFAPGFEAATLKYPTLLEADDRIPPCKKPIIGFAKFRSRTEANYARDLLNGRRIDSDVVAAAFILKAEIAKKNLHIKRSGPQLASCPSLSEQFHQTKTFIQPTSAALTPTSATLVPSLSNSPVLNQNKVLAKGELSAFDENPASNPVVPWSIFNLDATDSNPNASTSSFSARPVKSVSRLRIDTCDSVLDGQTHKTVDNTESRNLTLMTGNMVGPTPASIASAGYRCPADHNPPCNTLYVGNLPVNTNEVELRDLFGRCAGYRRMSFRMRVNGPMVFVEFDSIPYAQQALNELHGTLLSNSVKGGIRLSFSKNPLGVRPMASHQQMNAQMSTSNWSSLPSPSLLTPISGLFGSGEMMV
ncbi:hypothetical protein BJ741DRAFT_526855, partial [Chytriomyces cf. hyalinus JEL632]